MRVKTYSYSDQTENIAKNNAQILCRRNRAKAGIESTPLGFYSTALSTLLFLAHCSS